ncbi:MAG TPA: alpha-hydroxy acid oxidase [Thermoanaerobaculia bacterium]|jgi:4-hydroxymandelate oxidase|nr:alpha-hydroxy acid oxidase [Thermoanaerobaculia bacterium]
MNEAKNEPFNLADYEQLARERLPRMVYDYYAGGAGDEVSVRENELAWSRVRLRPRVLVDVSACDLSTTVLGRPVAMPVLTAPCGMNVLAHPDGELAVARATAAAGIVQVLSTLSGHSLEDIAAVSSAAGGAQWFQLYCYRDRGITRELVARAEAAGFLALCVTVDVPVLGYRERDARNRFHLPPGVRVANITQQVAEIDRGSALLQYVSDQFDPSLTWESVDWLRSITRLPVVLKGVLAAEDARLAVEHGAAGVIVSNHGGRQLDGTVAPCDALPEIAEAVARAADTAEVYVDGGIRRGVDVLKALALGARAVLIGRPYLWALAAEGEAGVLRLLHMLRDELQRSLALAGCPRVRDVRPSLIAR